MGYRIYWIWERGLTPEALSDIAPLLENLGFVVTTLIDADLQTMEESVRDFVDSAENSEIDTTFFYYAGHGVQSEGVNYLVPIDANIQRDYELTSKTFSIETLSKGLERSSSALNLLILDACRDNPFSTSRGGDRGLSAMSSGTRESMIVFTTAPGDVAQDGIERNSPFASAFKENILTPDLEIRQLIAEVSRTVQKKTGGLQIPWVNSSFTGEFFFITSDQELALRQQQMIMLNNELKEIQGEIERRANEIASSENSEDKQRLEIEQQRSIALAEAKKLEEQRIATLRSEAEERMATQQEQQEAKEEIENRLLGESASLILQAQKRREELELLNHQQINAQGAWGRLRTVAQFEKTIIDVNDSYDLSIQTANNEFEELKYIQVASYEETNPKDPWETLKEYEERVTEFESTLVAENEQQIAVIKSQKTTEIGKLRKQMNDYKSELTDMEFTIDAGATVVEVLPFNVEKKYFPIKITSNEINIPFVIDVEYTITGNDRSEIEQEYYRVENADKADGLIADIVYMVNEEVPGVWSISVLNVSVYSLLEGDLEQPGALLIADREDSSGLKSPEVLVKISDGMVTKLYAAVPIRAGTMRIGEADVYLDSINIGKTDLTYLIPSRGRTSYKFIYVFSDGIKFESTIYVLPGLNEPVIPKNLARNNNTISHYVTKISDDKNYASTVNNADGKVNAGETIRFDASMHNTGSAQVQNLKAVYSTESPYITFTSGKNIIDYGDVSGGL